MNPLEHLGKGCLYCGEPDPSCLLYYPVRGAVSEPVEVSRTAHMTAEQARVELGLCLVRKQAYSPAA